MENIKVYIKSKKQYLLEAMIGVEVEKMFTGIIISNGQRFYLTHNELYAGSHPHEDLVEGPEKDLWTNIFEKAESIFSFDLDKIDPEKITFDCIYEVYLNNKSLFFTLINEGETSFLLRPADLLGEFIPNKESIINELESSFLIHATLLRLEKLILEANNLGAQAEINKLLSGYGLTYTPEQSS